MVERTTPKEPIELAWDEYVASMEGRLHGHTDAFKFAWRAAQRTWQGLTDDDEILAISNTMPYADRFEFARVIESKLKQKNGYAEEKNT